MLRTSLLKFHAENPAEPARQEAVSMSKAHGPLADRPNNPKVGLEIPHESADLHVTGRRCTPTISSVGYRTRCTPGRCRPRTRTPRSPSWT